MKINIKKLPESMVEIEGELEADAFEAYYKKAIKVVSENFEAPGFRKGKVPENIILTNVPEIRILEEMAEIALSEHYIKILQDEKIEAVGRPEIAITKLARNNPLEFKIKTAVVPDVKLPDYKKIAAKIISEIPDADKNTEATDEEVEKTIMDIRKSRAPKVHVAEGAELKDGPLESLPKDRPLEELPPFDDEYVRALGPFENVEDFKLKLRENIKLEKGNQAKEKTRLKIVEKIIDEAKIDMPRILVEAELDKILFRMESDITQMGMKFDDYLTHLKKTVADLRKDFENDAIKKAKLGLVLNGIAETEKIKPEEADVAAEVAHLLDHYKDADPERARIHTENVLTNEKVFQFLEKQA